jgi:class 3 adenylate cyclase
LADNDIDASILRDLTNEDLEKIGVSLGHRKKMLRAIAELDEAACAPEPARRHEAERRQLTVMFADLVGSTVMSTRLDPEDLREVIGAYHRCCGEQIAKSGGFVARYMGDGILAYFGYPQAHEDDAERAVRAGLASVAAVAKLGDGAGAALRMRIGIATGLVVVGDAAAQEHDVVGETPNLAARLQALAEPDAIVIDASTRRLLAGLFEYHDLGAIEVKGFAAPVQAYQVIRQSAVESRFEALRATRTPLVGREEEIDLLMRRWQQAKGGDGSVVLISGEPGIGKSRIAQTILKRLGAEQCSFMRYFCSPLHQDIALYPAITRLERAAGFRREDTAEQRLDKLQALLAQGTNDLSEAAPLIADLLSIPTGERYPAHNLTPQKRKEKTLEALVTQVAGLALRQPVLVVFEDVHWSDPTTRESLDLLIDRVPTVRVLVVLTFRPEFTPPWVGRSHVTLLSLSRLPRRQRAEMITRVTGGKVLPKEITDQIIDRTDGVPLFIEELTKAVIESGVLTDAGDRYTVAGPLPPLAIPTTLNASLLARLDRLAPAREVAQLGAALGRRFSHELISAVAAMPQQQLDDALAQLVSAELIFRRGTPPDAEYTFKHALVQDAAYSTLLRGRRQQLHARIAATLEERFPEIVMSQPELLAHHCAEGNMAEKAAAYCLAAGEQALARSAMVEAVARLRKGLTLLTVLPDNAERWRHELNLQIALGRALIATEGQGARAIGEAYARACQLCEQLEARAQLLPVLFGHWVHFLLRAELMLARRSAAELQQLGTSQDDASVKFVPLQWGDRPLSRRVHDCARGLGAKPRFLRSGATPVLCRIGSLRCSCRGTKLFVSDAG